jgi:glycerol-3-phosphate cytidylyltransferase-like family protein
MTSKGTVLKKQTVTSHIMPIKRLWASSVSDLFILAQIWRKANQDIIYCLKEATNDVLVVRSQLDVCALGVFATKHLRHNMSIRDCSHAGKSIVFSFAGINLTSVFLNSSLCTL